MATVEPGVTYGDLPYKISLAVLMLARTTEPLAISAIQSCIFFQLRHFSPSANSAVISSQAGLLVSCRTIAHVCTGVLWGWLADSKYGGRKPVLITGLLSCGIGLLGYGLSRSFKQALAWQILDGAMNSSVPMIRCMIAELYPEKRYLARTLTLLPLSASLGMSLGPILGGFLAADFQTCRGGGFRCTHPFALPSMLIAGYCIVIALLSLLILQEKPHDTCSDIVQVTSTSDEPNESIVTSEPQSSTITKSPTSLATECEPLLKQHKDKQQSDALSSASTTSSSPTTTRLCTSQVIYTMGATFLIAGHISAFSILWPIFLSAPYQLAPSSPNFAGGLNLTPRQVATCISLLGLPSILLQISIYPSLNDRFGTVAVWRNSLWCFPLAYAFAPLSTLSVHATRTGQLGAVMPLLWLVVVFVLSLTIAGRTGVTPATTMLINACTPRPGVRGTVHTIGTTVAGLGRSLFPALILPVFGYGMKSGFTALGLWILAALAIVTCLFSRGVEAGRGLGKGSARV